MEINYNLSNNLPKFILIERINIYMQINKVLKAIADEDSISLFDAIASSNLKKDKSSFISISQLNLTRKQYYSRIRNLVNAGLIIKIRGPGNYRLTIFGETIYHFLDIIKIIASEDTYLKLKAIDAIIFGKKDSIKNENILQLIDTLIDNYKTRDILLEIFEKKKNMNDNDKTHLNSHKRTISTKR